MALPTTRQLLQRLAAAFAVAFIAFTVVFLALFTYRQWPKLDARGGGTGELFESLWLSLPFTAALTIPMAVLVAVLWVFSRLGNDGLLGPAVQRPGGMRRLLLPVLGAASLVGTLSLASNTLLIPRANERLAGMLNGSTPYRSDRVMTVSELREAARTAVSRDGARGRELAASYEAEAQKKFALAAASVILALVGAAIALRFPRGGVALVVGASTTVFVAYYLCVVLGETLADGLLVSPFVGMWMANVLLALLALALAWRSDGPTSPLDRRAIVGARELQ